MTEARRPDGLPGPRSRTMPSHKPTIRLSSLKTQASAGSIGFPFRLWEGNNTSQISGAVTCSFHSMSLACCHAPRDYEIEAACVALTLTLCSKHQSRNGVSLLSKSLTPNFITIFSPFLSFKSTCPPFVAFSDGFSRLSLRQKRFNI